MRSRALALVLLLAFFGAGCSATASWIPVESAAPAAAPLASPPTELAFVEDDDMAAEGAELEAAEEPTGVEEPTASAGFCDATANIWVHSAALNLIGGQANPEMTRVAMANVAEWLERSTLFTEHGATDRAVMFAAFAELEETAGADFGYDWQTFQSSTAYANDEAAQTYEMQRKALVPFINNECDGLSIRDLSTEADARVDELLGEFSTEPSKVVESDALPGHSIFTHSSGRLIASFPSAWDWEEGRSDAIVDLIASKDIERFLAGDALDGVRIQLLAAATLADFRTLISDTQIGSTCVRTSDRVDDGATRLNITQAFDCPDHGAAIVGQYRAASGLGLIIEASFDRPEPGNADLMRLASIANSALWS